MVLRLHHPNSSLKSRQMRPSRKASMALSGEMFSDILRRLSQRDIYDLKLSPVFCTHRRSSSNDVGRHEVPQKFAMNACRNSSQERMLSGARLLSQALVLSFKCRDSSCRALCLYPPLIVTVVMKSSSQIQGSCYPLNLTTPLLSFIPIGSSVERIKKLKHSAPHSP
jgi:hypothetical protein